MDKINVITIVSNEGKTIIVLGGKIIDLKDVVSMDIHIDIEGVEVITKKVERMKLGGK